MINTRNIRITTALACLCYCLSANLGHAQHVVTHDIHPTAQVHPSVILEGHVQIGAYTRIGPGTVLTGDITIGHHTLIQCNVTIRGKVKVGNYTHIYDNVCIEGGRPPNLWTTTNDTPDEAIIGSSAGSTMGPPCMVRRWLTGQR